MNYPANTIQWKPGDLVLHDADAKREDMLMRVVNYARDGRCRTEYVTDSENMRWRMFGRGKRSRLLNPISVLHDPARFGVSVEKEVKLCP